MSVTRQLIQDFGRYLRKFLGSAENHETKHSDSRIEGVVFLAVDRLTKMSVNCSKAAINENTGWSDLKFYTESVSEKVYMDFISNPYKSIVDDIELMSFHLNDISGIRTNEENLGEITEKLRRFKPKQTISLRVAVYAKIHDKTIDWSKDKQDFENEIGFKDFSHEHDRRQLEKQFNKDLNDFKDIINAPKVSTNKDIEILKRIVGAYVNDKSKTDRIIEELAKVNREKKYVVFSMVDNMLEKSDYYRKNNITSYNSILETPLDKVTSLHILLAEYIVFGLERKVDSLDEPNKQLLIKFRDFIFIYHKEKKMLTEDEKGRELIESGDGLIKKWGKKTEELGIVYSSTPTYAADNIPQDPSQMYNQKSGNENTDASCQTKSPVMEKRKATNDIDDLKTTIQALSMGAKPSEELRKFRDREKITEKQMLWLASKKFINPQIFVSQGMMDVLVDTTWFAHNFSMDLSGFREEDSKSYDELVLRALLLYLQQDVMYIKGMESEKASSEQNETLRVKAEIRSKTTIACECFIERIDRRKKDRKRGELVGNLTASLREKRFVEDIVRTVTEWKDDMDALKGAVSFLSLQKENEADFSGMGQDDFQNAVRQLKFTIPQAGRIMNRENADCGFLCGWLLTWAFNGINLEELSRERKKLDSTCGFFKANNEELPGWMINKESSLSQKRKDITDIFIELKSIGEAILDDRENWTHKTASLIYWYNISDRKTEKSELSVPGWSDEDIEALFPFLEDTVEPITVTKPKPGDENIKQEQVEKKDETVLSQESEQAKIEFPPFLEKECNEKGKEQNVPKIDLCACFRKYSMNFERGQIHVLQKEYIQKILYCSYPRGNEDASFLTPGGTTMKIRDFAILKECAAYLSNKGQRGTSKEEESLFLRADELFAGKEKWKSDYPPTINKDILLLQEFFEESDKTKNAKKILMTNNKLHCYGKRNEY